MGSGSILSADFGSVTTRLVLFDVVDGEYRLVARADSQTTLGTPVDDISAGLTRLLREMGQSLGRAFVAPNGLLIMPEAPDRSGVDLFVTTASAGRPLRAVLVGLLPNFSLKSAQEALTTAYIEPVGSLDLYSQGGEESHLNTILLAKPDLILVVGGTDGGAQQPLLPLLKAVRTALKVTDESVRPTVVFAGNQSLVPLIREQLGDVTRVLVAPNVRPNLETQALEGAQLALSQAYDTAKERFGSGFNTVATMSQTGILPTAQSYSLMAEYLSKIEQDANVMAVDMGSGSSVMVGVFNGVASTRINPRKGLGHSAKAMLDLVGADAIRMWLPFYATDQEIQHYALNKTLRPHTLPMTLRDLALEHAFLRAGLRDMVKNARALWQGTALSGELPPVQKILVGGSALTRNGTPAYDMMLIADCLQPSGITDIFADPYGVIPAVGALATLHPEATVQLMDAKNLEYLGTLISVSGSIKPDKPVAKIKVLAEGLDTIDATIKGGHLLFLPIPPEVEIAVDIRLMRGFRIEGKGRIKRTFYGGKAGILIDARGRDFVPASQLTERATQMMLWVHEATDLPLQVIPQEWLIMPEVATATPTKDQKTTKTPKIATDTPKEERRGLFGFGRSKPKPQATPTGALAPSDDDDDFMRLIEEDEMPPNKKQTDKLDDDLDALRGLV